MSVAPMSRSFRAGRAAGALTGALTLALLAGCVVPPRPPAVSPAELPARPPAVSIWSPSTMPGAGTLPSLYFSTDRAAYASVFDVDRNGRVRVIYPRTPREAGRVQPGRTYTAISNGISTDRTFLTPATNWQRLPFLFVVVSDRRPDLAAWGSGRAWSRQVRVDGVEAEDVIAAVAERVTGGAGGAYTTDFTYLTPRLSPREALFAAQCARVATDPKDYWYFRDLWAVFTPADPTLGLTPIFSFGSMVTWASTANLGYVYDRAQFAVAAFRGGCTSPFYAPRRNPLYFATFRPPASQPGPVAAGPVRLQPLPGAQPTELRVPRTPKEIADERVGGTRPAGTTEALLRPSAAEREAIVARVRPSARITRTLEVGGSSGLTPEPLDRPPGVDDRPRGVHGGWGGGGSSTPSERIEGSWHGRPGGDVPRRADTGGERIAPQPRSEPRAEPRSEPRYEPRPAPRSEPRTEPRPEPQPVERPRMEPRSEPMSRPIMPSTEPSERPGGTP